MEMSIWSILATTALAISSDASASFEAIIANGKGQAKDQFFETSEVPALPDDVIYVPLKDAKQPWPDPLTDGSYRYEGGRLILSYSASQHSNAGSSQGAPLTHWNEIAVWSLVRPAGSFVGANAYGASASIEVFERDTVKLRFNEGPNHPAGVFRRAELELIPSEARMLASNAALEIRLHNPADVARQADCEFGVRPARLNRPKEVRDTICVVSVRVASIRIIRRDTGEEIPTDPL